MEKNFTKTGKFLRFLEKCSFRKKSLVIGLAKTTNNMKTLNMAKFAKYSGAVQIEISKKNLQPLWKKWKNSKIQKISFWKTSISVRKSNIC
jgi:hypothetical protein